MHVALHGAYHRGQVARIVRGEGGAPQGTDYIFHIRERS
ncbi:MAG: DinB family protein [Gemmatimonadales bacterium]